jgi:hypothetical protein
MGGGAARQSRTSNDLARAEVVKRLDARRADIEEAITVRAFAVAKPTGRETPGYVEGLRDAISAAVVYAVSAIECGADRVGSPPPEILRQARNAASSGVGLEVVLRRYAAGYSVLGDALARETRTLASPGTLYHLQRELTALFDRLVEAVTSDYRAEAERIHLPADQRQAQLISRLLAGELIDTSSIDYDFDSFHLGVVACGRSAKRLLRDLAARLDRRLLTVEDGSECLSAWFGGRREFDHEELDDLARYPWPADTLLAIGEPSPALSGWRRSHRQARAALRVALRSPQPFTRYGAVALLTAVSNDEDLLAFLNETYLAPLSSGRDGGKALRKTVWAYLACGRNVSSAAAALGLARQTVASRLQATEKRLGRPVDACGAELELILRLLSLDS